MVWTSFFPFPYGSLDSWASFNHATSWYQQTLQKIRMTATPEPKALQILTLPRAHCYSHGSSKPLPVTSHLLEGSHTFSYPVCYLTVLGNAISLLCADASPCPQSWTLCVCDFVTAVPFSDWMLHKGSSLNTHTIMVLWPFGQLLSLLILAGGPLKSGTTPCSPLCSTTLQNALPILMLSPLRMDRWMNR